VSKLIKEMLDALNAVNQNKTQPFDRQGEVKRIEGKIAWVKLEGSDRETPIQMTIACDVGDTVQARIGGGSAWLTGNLTAPPTDDKKANQAISMVTTVVQEVQEQVEEALEDVSTVDDVTMQYCLSDSSSTFVQYGDWSNTPPTYVSGKYYWTRSVLVDDDGNETYGEPRYSQDTQLSVETDVAFKSNNNHFWYDSSGAYVTTANKNYSSGYATRITSSGILQSYNNYLLSGWTNSGIAFYAGDGTTASNSTTLASFGSGGADLYAGGNLGASVGSSGMTVYSSGNDVAFIGTGTGALKGYARIGKLGTNEVHTQLSNTTLGFYQNNSDLMCYISGGTSYTTDYSMSIGTASDKTLMLAVYGDINTNKSGVYKSGGYKILTTGTVTATGSVAANATGSGTATASKTGYTPIGILGFEPSGSNYGHLNIYNVSLSGSTVTWRGYNFGSDTASVTMTITVLYIASSQGV
jgi:hypothetical protein